MHEVVRAEPTRRLAYGIDEAAAALGVSTATIFRLMRRGELQVFKLGSRTLIPAKAIDELIEQRTGLRR